MSTKHLKQSILHGKIAECERSGSEILFYSVSFESQKCSTFKITLIIGLLLVLGGPKEP